MSDSITLTGVIGTEPRHIVTAAGVPITSFRLATSQSRFDSATNRWVEISTNWYTVSTYRQVALNARQSLRKGEHVVVSGRIRLSDWTKGERSGTAVDVDAEAIGHDLKWCTSSSARVSTPDHRAAGGSSLTQDQALEQGNGADRGSTIGPDGLLPPTDDDSSFEHSLAALDS